MDGPRMEEAGTQTQSGGTLTELHHVYCTGNSECTAVGSYKNC